jgi:hypothetical protein
MSSVSALLAQHARLGGLRPVAVAALPSGSRTADEVEQVFLGRRLIKDLGDAKLGGALPVTASR